MHMENEPLKRENSFDLNYKSQSLETSIKNKVPEVKRDERESQSVSRTSEEDLEELFNDDFFNKWIKPLKE